MRDETTMVAIEAALRSSTPCQCGDVLDIHARGGDLWLECRTFAQPSRLPAGLALALRSVLHSSSYVASDPSGAEARLPRDARAAVRRATPAQA